MDYEVAIIGAGVAGMAAAGVLARAGKRVYCLEATDRIGGRVLTVHDPLSPLPIELGAEFVHGRPPEIWDLIRSAELTAYEHTPEALYARRGRGMRSDVAEMADRVLQPLAKGNGRDVSFEAYLRRSRQPAEIKEWARLHVEGFHAARADTIGVASLRKDQKAAGAIEGGRTFRVVSGYDTLALALLRSIPEAEHIIDLNSVVESVAWQRGAVEVHYRSALDGEQSVLRCAQLIVTVPLGVLQAGAIRFDPEPGEALQAAAALRFGQVYRVSFRFRDPFWEDDPRLQRLGFLVSREKRFSTWWTMHPIVAPLLTGWMAGTAAEEFQTEEPGQVASEALASLERILGRKVPHPEAFYFHDWRRDPFFRGAYSYVPAGALPAREALARPVEDTLFFAGEAAELNGHGGTVHGALASGTQAAERILEMTGDGRTGQ